MHESVRAGVGQSLAIKQMRWMEDMVLGYQAWHSSFDHGRAEFHFRHISFVVAKSERQSAERYRGCPLRQSVPKLVGTRIRPAHPTTARTGPVHWFCTEPLQRSGRYMQTLSIAPDIPGRRCARRLRSTVGLTSATALQLKYVTP